MPVNPELVITKGLHLAGTQLNLDEPVHGRISVVTNVCVQGLRKKVKVIITPQLIDIIGRSKYLQAMPLRFGKTTGMGKININLYPSGFSKGSSMVLIDTGDVRYLYASLLGLDQRRSTAEGPRIPKADILVLRHANIDFHSKNLSAVRAANEVMPAIEQSLSAYKCALVLPSLVPDAVELALALKAKGVRVLLHKSILHFSQRLGVPGFQAVKQPPGKRIKPAVVLWPYSLSGSQLLREYNGPRFCQPGNNGDVEIPFSGMIDPWRLMKLVRMSHAKQVLVFGNISKKAQTMLNRAGLSFSIFYNPDQLTMPL